MNSTKATVQYRVACWDYQSPEMSRQGAEQLAAQIGQQCDQEHTIVPAARPARGCARCDHGLDDLVGYVVTYTFATENDVTFRDVAYVEGARNYEQALTLVRKARESVRLGIEPDAVSAVIHSVHADGHRPV